MTQEQKDLLIKDLCARLPYGVKCKDVTIDFIGTMTDISRHDNMCKLYNDYGDNYTCFMANCKPYLLPLSRMNEEQERQYSFFSTIIFSCFEVDLCEAVAKFHDWFNRNHIDYNGLIEKGLAIEAPEGMYN